MSELPDNYTPGSREKHPLAKLYVIVYCIEYTKKRGAKERSYIIEGPTKEIFDLLDMRPDKAPAKIVRFDPPNAARTELYSWAGTKWDKVPEGETNA